MHRYHKSCSQADLTVLRVITIVWTKTSKMSYISEFSVEVSQIVFSAHLTVLRLVTTVRVKTSISHISGSSVHKYHKSCFQPIWLFYGLFTTVWAKTFKISYLRDFSAQASQFVFWRHLTVLRLITTVWAKTWKMSYVREFSPQVSQIVFSAQLTVFTACNNIMNINFKNLISQVVE